MTSDLLLLTDSERRPYHFGPYGAELLRLEGLGAPDVCDPRRFLAGAAPESPGRIVVANTPLGAEEARALKARVAQGGRLVAFLPGPELAAAFGFRPTYRTTLDGYLRLCVPGFPDDVMQFHGPLRHMEPPPGADVLAEQVAGPDHPDTLAPAVVRLREGAGEAVFFLYDLPQSVALTRQGDPRRLSLHANEVAPGWRAADMFAGHLDMDCARLPQADLQCHFLRHLLTAEAAALPPLPWLWYFPDNADTVLAVSSDDDWSTPEQFDALLDCARRYDARISFYLVPDTAITPARRAALAAEGHTFSLHPVLAEPVEWTWQETVAAHREAFQARFGVEPGRSVRNHAIPWVGWTQGGAWMRAAGFTWDSNHFTCPPRTRFYMTGAGLPCPLVDLDGAILDMFEQAAQFSDETTLAAGGFPFSLHYTTEEAAAVLGEMLRANAAQWHSLLCINTHPVSFATYSGPLWEAVFAAARERGIPRMSLEGWAAFWERRHRARIGPACPTPGGWQWEVEAEAGPESLCLLLPETWNGGGLAGVRWNEVPVTARPRRVHARPGIVVAVPPGANTLAADYAPA